MKPIRTFKELHQQVSTSGTRRRIVAVRPEDEATIEALQQAEEQKLASYPNGPLKRPLR